MNHSTRVYPANPRYFTVGTTNADGTLKAIYLGGHQILVDLQDNAFNKEWTKDMGHPEDPAAKARLLDWDRYLDWIEELQFNYVRNWIIWSTGSGTAAPPNKVASPMPFLRTGPGNANDGKSKFDLHRLDENFFQRLHDRARSLQERGVYLSVMLFELYGFLNGEEVNGQRLWEGNPFPGANNIKGLDVDRNHNRLGEEFFSLDDLEVVNIQKTYLEKMVDSLNDLDNILWEICNEPPSASIGWQYAMLEHLKNYEARKPKQHLILQSPGGWTAEGWALSPEEKFIAGAADCIATANGWIDRENPKVYQINKPVFMDLDHVTPGSHDPALVWKAFTRGYHFSLYDHPFEQPQDEAPAWQVVRANLQHTHMLAGRVRDLSRMSPRPDLASTSFCLADAGREYLIYQPKAGEDFSAQLSAGTYHCEWFNPAKGQVAGTGNIEAAGGWQQFKVPFEGDAVLYLQRVETAQ